MFSTLLGMRYKRRMLAIRQATAGDAATILSFIRALASFEREPDAVKVTAETLRQQLLEPNPPFECLIASLDGADVGFALFFSTYSTWLGKRGIWLEDLFVLESARRHGVGSALLCRVAQLAAERQCGRLEWSVLDWNQSARDFYERMGAKVMEEWRICRMTPDAP